MSVCACASAADQPQVGIVQPLGPHLPKLLPNSDDSGEEDGEQQSSDDSSDSPKKKRFGLKEQVKMRSVAPFPVFSAALPDARKKSKNKGDLWASVINEQDLSKGLNSWFGINPAFNSDRDVEAYDYIKAREMKAIISLTSNDGDSENSDGATMDDDGDKVLNASSLATHVPYTNDQEMFGTGVTVKEMASQSEKDVSGIPGPGTDGERRLWRRKRTILSRNSEGLPTSVVAAHSRLGMRGFDPAKDRSHIHASAGDPVDKVAKELVRVLKEPENMLPTFGG